MDNFPAHTLGFHKWVDSAELGGGGSPSGQITFFFYGNLHPEKYIGY